MSGGYPTWAVMSPKRLAHVERVVELVRTALR